jgi:hypothetical protein
VTSRVPSRLSDRGVYVVAYGDPARACARTCLATWREHMPHIPIALASDRKLASEDVLVLAKDEDIGGRSVKTKVWDLAPARWKYVLYVDADTELSAPVPFLFDALVGGWDFLICLNAQRYTTAANMGRPDNKEECAETYKLYGTKEFLQFNGGVFGFVRNERTHALLDGWHREWDRFGKRDQAALLRALHANPVKMLTLGVEWNTSLRYYDAKRSAGILHNQMRARRWKGIIDGRSDSTEAWAAVHPSREDWVP